MKFIEHGENGKTDLFRNAFKDYSNFSDTNKPNLEASNIGLLELLCKK